jgi:hypothetical protein
MRTNFEDMEIMKLAADVIGNLASFDEEKVPESERAEVCVLATVA